MKFTVITVCLNPGDKLKATLESVLGQTCTDAEVILKDGGSTDDSVSEWRQRAVNLPGAERVKIYVERDGGIYDAMNQAVAHAQGEYLLFLNCGDVFYDSGVLDRISRAIEAEAAGGTDCRRLVMYGDTYSEKNKTVIASAPSITGFTCYRNIPCHQSCVYSASLCREKPYDLKYKIRADYDHFLWCFYQAQAKICHMDFPVASYEGGGYSENRENRRQDAWEHRQITSNYMSKWELFLYRGALVCTLAPLRRAMAESSIFSEVYHRIKKCLYARKK